MDQIIITDLEVHYRVGVPEAERQQPQRLLISVEMGHDFSRAIASDDLAQTIDYHAVAQRILRFGDDCQWKLIETVAADLARMVLDETRASQVTVEVKKFIIPQARHVAVKVTRVRQSTG
jgi:7,8-dihydroneopterin aldolase/epimerase/oxygenase